MFTSIEKERFKNFFNFLDKLFEYLSCILDTINFVENITQ